MFGLALTLSLLYANFDHSEASLSVGKLDEQLMALRRVLPERSVKTYFGKSVLFYMCTLYRHKVPPLDLGG